MALILLLAIFFRLFKLNSIPPGLYSDEAINANQALSQPGQIFYPENNGREGLFINLVFLSFKIFGPSIWSFRLVPAVFGTLTIFSLYFLAKELFEDKLIAVFSSLFLATSFWHVNFSRIGFRAILFPFFLCLAIYFLFKGFKQKRKVELVLAGIAFGLGFYTYTAFRVAVLILVPFLIIKLIEFKKQRKQFLLLVGVFLFSAFIVSLPIGIYFLQNPEYFSSRITDVLVFSQENVLKALAETTIKHLAMFNFVGDHNWRHNIGGSPLLFWPTGLLFVVGLLYSLKEIIVGLKKKSLESLSVYITLLTWWLVMLLPAILTYEGIPHALRSIGSIPPVFLFAGLGLSAITKTLQQKLKLKNLANIKLIKLTLTVLLISFLLAQYLRYFEIWAKNPETNKAFSKEQVLVGQYLNSLPKDTSKYVISLRKVEHEKDLPMSVQTILFIEKTKNERVKTTYLSHQELDKIQIDPGKKATIILADYDTKTLVDILRSFRGGTINKIGGIWIYDLY